MQVKTFDNVIHDVTDDVISQSDLLSDLLSVTTSSKDEVVPLSQVDNVTMVLIINLCKERVCLKDVSEETLVKLVNACLFMSMPRIYDACIEEYQSRIVTYYEEEDIHKLEKLLPIEKKLRTHKSSENLGINT